MTTATLVARIKRTQGAVLIMTQSNDDTPTRGTNLRSLPPLNDPPEYYSDPVVTPARTPNAKKARGTWRAPRDVISSMRPNRPGSYGLAVTLITLAVSSSAGIANPLHRTLVILLIAIVVYFIGLQTQ
jgi:hypothetical protein